MKASRFLFLSAVVTAALGCGPDEPGLNIKAVRILSPLSGTILGTADDLNGSDPGLAIRATAVVFVDDGNGGEEQAGDGVIVRLRTNQLNEQAATTENGQAFFDSFLLLTDSAQPSVLNALQACVTLESGQELCSEAVVVQTDIVGPPCNIVVPGNNSVLDEQDDADLNLLNGFQLAEAIVSTDAGDGTQVLLNVNNTQAGASVVQGSVARFVQVKLEPGQNTLDAKCLDQAGNEGTGSSSVSVNVTLPSISITAPAPNSTISSNFSPASFNVTTSSINVEPGQEVFLSVDGGPPLPSVLTDGAGNAEFTVQLGEGNHTLKAQTSDLAGTPAESLVVSIIVDIIDQPPTVALFLPSCSGGNVQFFSGDDIDSNAANGIQTQILVSSTGTDVDLVSTPAAGAVFSDTQLVNAGFAQFPSVTFQSGANVLSLTPRDTDTGLTGTPVICNIQVIDDDFLTLAEPADGAILGLSADTDGNPANGLQIRARVAGTSGIVNGTLIDFQVNGTTVQSKGMVNGQVVFDGADAIPILVQGSVTLSTDGPGTIIGSSITVIVDTQAPAQVNNLSCDLVSARDGTAVCTFTAPQDPTPGTGVSKYEIRVLENQVINDANFAAATVVAAPSFVGGTEVVNFTGLRPGPTFHAALVSIDEAGNRSVVSNDAVVEVNNLPAAIPFASITVPAVSAGGLFGITIDAAGDLNNDGIDDLIVAAPFAQSPQGEVYIYYGAAQDPSLTFAAPSATIVGVDGFAGLSLASIGDFDGDSIPDFAIGEPFSGGGLGTVYIFRGRSGANTITGTRSVLQADMIINNNPLDINSNFGGALSPAGDVDGDGRDDLLIGAASAQNGNGAAYLVYGQPLNAQQNVTFPNAIGQEFRGLNSDAFATGLSPIGDITGDGFDDLAIGAPQFDILGGETGPGYVAVFSGGVRPALAPVGDDSLTRDDAFAVLTGLAQGIDFGLVISAVGAVDGDNSPSLLVSDRSANNSAGEVYLFDNIAPGTTNAANALVLSNSAIAFFGVDASSSISFSATSPFDIDKDGFADILIADFTSAYVLYGDGDFFGVSPLDPVADSSAVIVPDALTGVSAVQFVGDVNADGFVDFVISDFNAAAGDGAFQLFF